MKKIITLLISGILIGIIFVIIIFLVINKSTIHSQHVVPVKSTFLSIPQPTHTPLSKITNCQGFVNINDINPHIIVDIKYATRDNVFKEVLYPKNSCYLRKDVAINLSNIQKKLEKKKMGLKCWDCYRPLSVQKRLWAIIPDPNFVSPPYTGTQGHSRGISVDLTLVDDKGTDLQMPTNFDDFSIKASQNYDNLPKLQIKNRNILKKAMEADNFNPIESEWWHYNYVNYSNYSNYKVADVSFDDLKNCSPNIKK